jgi:hypothetical protein
MVGCVPVFADASPATVDLSTATSSRLTRLQLLLALLAATLVCWLAPAAAASAQANEGAQFFDFEGCGPVLVGEDIVCFSGRNISLTTRTPSGVLVGVTHFQLDQLLTTGACAGSESDLRGLLVSVLRVEASGVSALAIHDSQRITADGVCGGVTFTCRLVSFSQAAHDGWVVQRFESTCVET